MKTTTYLRLSLLIPLNIWGVGVLLIAIASTRPEIDLGYMADASGPNWVAIFFAFYIFGIIVWIFPYILLSLILFFWSFISQARTALKVFALSPLAMTILTIATLNLLALNNTGEAAILSNPVIDQDYIGLNIIGAAFTLIWGYICVGIGFGIYKLLQRQAIVREEETIESMPQPVNQYE
ncbi:MAG: hypothetical protein ABI621_14540 [Chloroflexota bacterium]